MLEAAAAASMCVGFVVGEVAYAFDIRHVREVLRPLPIRALPTVHEAFVGVVDHRGEVVPVLDLRIRFRVTPSGEGRMIMVQRAGRLLAVLVDRVTDVFDARGAEPRELSELGRAVTSGPEVLSVWSWEGTLTFQLDVERLVVPSSFEAVTKTIQNGREP